MFISLAARGEGYGAEIVDRGFIYSMKGVLKSSGTTLWFGMNLRASAFGVFSVWMKIVRTPVTKLGVHGCDNLARGRVLAVTDVRVES